MTGTTTLSARGVTGVHDPKTNKWLVTGRGRKRLVTHEEFMRLISPPRPTKERNARQ